MELRQLLDRIKAPQDRGASMDWLLEAVSRTGQYVVVPELVSWLDADDPSWICKLLDTICDLIERMPPGCWGDISEQIKTSWVKRKRRFSNGS